MNQPVSVCGYEILEELGRGTTGIVYKARHTFVRPDRIVALKLPSLGDESEAHERLAWYQNEWHVLRLLTWESDPGVPRLLDVGGGVPGQPNYYAREFVDGSTLEQLVATEALDLRNAIRVLTTISGIIQRVHGKWIVHRNLRASNVLVSACGMPKLIGFGFAYPLAGSQDLPQGIAGEPAEVDVRGLQAMLGWLCAALHKPVPIELEAIRHTASPPTLARFAESLESYLRVA